MDNWQTLLNDDLDYQTWADDMEWFNDMDALNQKAMEEQERRELELGVG